jgi:hypothetical protein
MRMLKHRLHPGMNKITVEADHICKFRYINDQDGKLCGWFQVATDTDLHLQPHEYEVYLALTGETIPDEYNYVCSHQVNQGGGYFVVHAYD